MISDKILKKVKNLLELGQSDNPHEAKLALENAHKLIREHSISDAELNKEDEKEIVVDFEKVKLAEYGYPWSRDLFNSVARAYHCDMICIEVSVHCPKRTTKERKDIWAHLVGTKGDREMVKLMYNFAVEAKERIVRAERKRIKINAVEFETSLEIHIRSFSYGVVMGMRKTLVEIENQNSKDKESKGAYGIVLVTTATKTKELFDKVYPKTSSMSSSRSRNTVAREQGYEQGKGINFNKQMSGKVIGLLS